MHALSPLDLNILYVLTLHAQRPKTIASALPERYKARIKRMHHNNGAVPYRAHDLVAPCDAKCS